MTKNHWSKLTLNWKWTTCLFHVFSLTPADFYSCQLITLFHLINQAIVINWNVCMYAEWQMLHSERASGEPAVSSHALQSLFHFYRQINTNAEDFRTWILMQVIKHGFFFFWQMTSCQALAWRGSMNRISSLSLLLLPALHKYILGPWFILTERWEGEAQRPWVGRTVTCKTQIKFPPSFWLCLLISRSWNKPSMMVWNCNWAWNIIPAFCREVKDVIKERLYEIRPCPARLSKPACHF